MEFIATDDYEEGVIMELHGLTNVTYNGRLISISNVIKDNPGRYACVLIPENGDDIETPKILNIKAMNLKALQQPTVDIIQSSQALANQVETNPIAVEDEVAIRLFNLYPSCGRLWEGKAHKEMSCQNVKLARLYWLRGLGNTDKTLSPDKDAERMWTCRVNYAAISGEAGKYDIEEEHLRRVVKDRPEVEATRLSLSTCLMENGKLDDAMEVLIPLYCQKTYSPRWVRMCGAGISDEASFREKVRQLLAIVSYRTYKLAKEMEMAGDELYGMGNREEAKEQYALASNLLRKAVDCMPEDLASNQAWFICQQKAHPDIDFTEVASQGVGNYDIRFAESPNQQLALNRPASVNSVYVFQQKQTDQETLEPITVYVRTPLSAGPSVNHGYNVQIQVLGTPQGWGGKD